MIYQFREGSVISGLDPTAVGQELDELRLKKGGVLKPADVVKRAAAARSAMHRYFEWDNDKAAHEFRLGQARTLIACIEVLSDDEPPVGARAFYNVRAAGGYIDGTDHEVVMNYRAELMKRALLDLKTYVNRYKSIADVVGFKSPLDAVISSLEAALRAEDEETRKVA